MSSIPSAASQPSNSLWFLVYVSSGAVAAVHAEDLAYFLGSGKAELVMSVNFSEAADFERARAAQSAICPRPVV